MSEADNLKAWILDLEDELTCLKADLMIVCRCASKKNSEEFKRITKAIAAVHVDIADTRDDLVELERENYERG